MSDSENHMPNAADILAKLQSLKSSVSNDDESTEAGTSEPDDAQTTKKTVPAFDPPNDAAKEIISELERRLSDDAESKDDDTPSDPRPDSTTEAGRIEIIKSIIAGNNNRYSESMLKTLSLKPKNRDDDVFDGPDRPEQPEERVYTFEAFAETIPSLRMAHVDMLANGWPVRRVGCKSPPPKRWQDYPVGDFDASYDPINDEVIKDEISGNIQKSYDSDGVLRTYPKTSFFIGMEPGIVAIDVDVDHVAMAEDVWEIIEPVLRGGRVVRRFTQGKAGFAVFARLDVDVEEDFTKLETGPHKGGGNDRNNVEVFGGELTEEGRSKRVFMVLGDHTVIPPDDPIDESSEWIVKRSYYYRNQHDEPNLSPLDCRVDELPLVTRDELDEMLSLVSMRFKSAGWMPLTNELNSEDRKSVEVDENSMNELDSNQRSALKKYADHYLDAGMMDEFNEFLGKVLYDAKHYVHDTTEFSVYEFIVGKGVKKHHSHRWENVRKAASETLFIRDGDGKKTDSINRYQMHGWNSDKLKCVRRVFEPNKSPGLIDVNEIGEGSLNEWMGMQEIDRSSDDFKASVDFVRNDLMPHIFTEEEEREYLYDWIAAKWHQPWQRLTAIYLAGGQGVGKGTFGKIVGHALGGGKYYVECTPKKVFHSDFNDAGLSKLIVHVPDMNGMTVKKEKYEIYADIKRKFDPNDTMSRHVNIKYEKEMIVSDYSCLIFDSNDPGAVHIDPDDRRIVVPSLGGKMGSELRAGILKYGVPALGNAMAAIVDDRKISTKRLLELKQAPDWKAKKKLFEETKSEVELAVRDALDECHPGSLWTRAGFMEFIDKVISEHSGKHNASAFSITKDVRMKSSLSAWYGVVYHDKRIKIGDGVATLIHKTDFEGDIMEFTPEARQVMLDRTKSGLLDDNVFRLDKKKWK